MGKAAARGNDGGLLERAHALGVLLGLPNTAIAARLVVSPKTVEHHVSAILRKLGVKSRGEVRSAASAHGLGPQT